MSPLVWPYVWLSLALVSLWIASPFPAGGWARVLIPAGWLVLAIGHAYATGIVTEAALPSILAFGLLCYGFRRALHRQDVLAAESRNTPTTWRAAVQVVAGTAVAVFALALMAHVVPGFHNVLIVKDATLSTGATPYTLYLNFDKGLAGFFLLAFGQPLAASRAQWTALLIGTLPRLLVLLTAVIVSALAIGYVQFDPKWPEILPLFIWANLLFTCASEEALFRGLIQRHLQGEHATDSHARWRALAGLVAASLLFGVAHFAGGAGYVALSTVAGLGYGWAYWRTGRIEASILTHFLLNLTHILAFTYPARL